MLSAGQGGCRGLLSYCKDRDCHGCTWGQEILPVMDCTCWKKKKNLRENGLGKLKTTEGASSGTPLHALIPLPICLKAFPLFPLAFLLYLTFAVFTTCLTFLPNFLYFPPSCFSLSATHSSQLWEFFAMFYHHLERCNFSGGRYLPFVPITLIQFCDLLPKSNKLQQNVPISTPEL